MNFATNRNIFILSFICLSLLIAAGSLNISYQKPSFKITKQQSALNFNDDLILIFSMGQKRLITDLFWIVTLLESDVEHYNGKDLNSWLYLRFKSIIKLDPKFLNAYRFGGKYLSIIKDDLLGAKEIFDQGLSIYPNDYNLLYDAGYLYAFELQDFEHATEIYKKLSTFEQAPDFVKSIVNKLDLELHKDLKLTFKIVHTLWKDPNNSEHLKEKLKADLYRIKAEIDLECLNTQKLDCDKKDFYGHDYILENRMYRSYFDFEPYRFKFRQRAN